MKPFAAIDFEEERGLRKKDLEERAVTGVLLRLGLSGFQVSLQERPDAIIDLSRGENRVRIACEVRTLYSDDGDGGSRFRRFRGRWLRIVDEVVATLQGDGTAVPCCVVDFLEPSYDCLKGLSDASLVDELVAAGRTLRTVTMIEFPQPQMPILSSTVQRIRVLGVDGAGLRWWPSHM